jgi:hypothetical protein
MLNTLLALFALVAFASSASAQPAPGHGKWATLKYGPSFDWPSAPGVMPATGAVKTEQVLTLMREIEGDQWDEITSFRFAPLSAGKLYLLVYVDSCPRGECGVLAAVNCLRNRRHYPAIIRWW